MGGENLAQEARSMYRPLNLGAKAFVFSLCLMGSLAVACQVASAQSLPSSGALITEPFPGEGTCISMGDLNGDGCDEFYLDLVEFRPFLHVLFKRAIVDGATGLPFRLLHDWVAPFQSFVPSESAFPLGDLDGDGDGEYAIMTVDDFNPLSIITLVEVYSGTAVAPLYVISWPGISLRGRNVFPLGDVDRDGIGDIGIRATAAPSSPRSESLFQISSGATGSFIFGTQSATLPLSAWAALGDVNADGHGDYAISSAAASILHTNGGVATIVSGANFNILHTFFGSVPNEFLGEQLLPLPDQDGDGAQDLLIFARGYMVNGSLVGRVRARSSATGNVLWQIVPPPGTFFQSLTAAGDLDGNGDDDFAIRIIGLGPQTSQIVYSGSDGSELFPLQYPSLLLGTGIGESFVGDTNGDGFDELAVMESIITSPVGPGVPNDIGTVTIARRQLYGAQSYGAATLGSTLSLDWAPNAGQSQLGFIELNGAAPNAQLFFGVSLAPWDGSTFGANHPLWISPLPQDLFITASVLADANGQFRSFETLSRPEIAGISLYLQGAQTTAPDAISNGLQLLYGN